MFTANIKTYKRCAVCKYWYDPTNSAITPRAPKINLWDVDVKCKKMCTKKNYETVANSFCNLFESKFE